MERSYFFYLVVLCFGSLSVYNFFKNLENHSPFKEITRNNDVGDRAQRYRQRRHVENDDDKVGLMSDLINFDKLNAFVEKKVNKTLQGEIKKVLIELIKNFSMKSLCQNIAKCKQDICKQDVAKKTVNRVTPGDNNHGNKTSTVICSPGPRGPPGPVGPVGPPGRRGLSLENPQLVNSTLDILANETDDVTFECVFFGNPIPTVEWESDSLNVSKVSQSIDKEKAEITSSLTVSNIAWSNRGQVKCKARSSLGKAAGSGTLKVLCAPVISLIKGPLFVFRGNNYQFPECKVRSFPKAKITWKRFSLPLPDGRHSTDDGVLKISRVRYDDEGFYICEAENFLGKEVQKIQLKTKSLELYEKPLPRLQGLKEVNIKCSAYGNPDEMSGKIMRIDGLKQTPVETIIKKSEILFSMTAVVKESGIYSCTIKFNEEEVKYFTNVQMFNILNSQILTNANDIQRLGGWLGEFSAHGKYVRCYNSITDGKSFYSKCGGKSNTITLIKYVYVHFYKGSKFYKTVGAYTDAAWVKPTSGTKISDSSNTFIFDIAIGEKYDAKPGKSITVCYMPYSPCFGNNEFYTTCCNPRYHWKAKPKPTFRNMYGSTTDKEAIIEVFYKL